jgi:hypothetical protein
MESSDYPVENDLSRKREKALKYCKEQIEFYEGVKRHNRLAFQVAQVLTIVLSGITPVLILMGDLSAPLQALPPALVTMIVGLSGIFQWKENYLRFASASEALKGELLRFETRTSEEYKSSLKGSTALDHFVTRVANIVVSETGEWRTLMREASEPEGNG